MKIKSAFCASVTALSIILSAFTGIAADTQSDTTVIQAQDSAVVSQSEPGKTWQQGEELLVDVNHRDVAFVKFKLPSELDENKEIVLSLHSTAAYPSEWKLYGLKSFSWDGASLTWNKAGGLLSKTDYRLFSDDAEYIATFPLLSEGNDAGGIDVTDYIMSNNISGSVTFGISALTSKSRIASHLSPDETLRPSLIISEKQNTEYVENIDASSYADAMRFAAALGYLPAEGDLYYPEREVTANEANRAFELMQHNTEEVFKKNSDVTAGNVVRELVIASGYDIMVKVSDKRTYLTVAKDAGITKSVQLEDSSKPVTRDVFAQLLYNTLNISMMEQVSFGTEDQYGENADKTILSQTRDIYKAEGIVDGNEYTYLTKSTGTSPDTVSIDGKLYYVGGTNAADDMLGYRVNAWYYDDKSSGNGELAYLEPDMDSDDVLDISYDELVDYAAFQYKYSKDDGSKILKANLSKGFDVIYNGACKSDFELSHLKPTYGTVRLINNDGDGSFDVVRVQQYENYVVTLADKSKCEIIDYYEPKRHQVIDETLAETLISNTDGQIISFSEIRQWNVVSVAKSHDGNVVKAIVNTGTVAGKVTQLTDDEVMIDNTLYKIAPSFLPYSSDVLKLGDNVTALIDVLGNIAGCRIGSSSDMTYGYLVDVKTSDGLDTVLMFKIFTVQGKMAYFNAAEKVTIDGERKNGSSQQLSSLGSTSQLIMYRTDDDGNIVEIDTKYSGAKEGKKQLTEILPLSSGLVYRNRAKSLSSKLVMNNDTIIFALPDDVKKADDKDFEIRRIANYANDQTLNSVCGYTSNNDSLIASAVTVLNAPEDGYSYLMLIDSVSYVLDADGKTACELTGIINGASDSVVVSGDFYNQAKEFEQGDFIRFSKNGYGGISKMQQIYDVSSDNPFLPEQPTSTRASYRVAYERIYNRKGNVIQTTMDFTNDTPDSLEVYDATLFPIYVYDKYLNNNRVYTGGVSMLTDYSNMMDEGQRVIICTNYGDPMAIVVYR